MKNCCVSGLHAELRFCFKAGTVLAVRVTGSSCGYSWEEGFRMKDLHQADDLRVLDCDGHRVFRNFTLGKLGQPMYHEPDLPGYSLLERTLKQEAVMIETHNDVIRLPARQHL
jgi:hypothetical protein